MREMTRAVLVRMTPDEHARLKAAAEANDVGMAELMRRATRATLDTLDTIPISDVGVV